MIIRIIIKIGAAPFHGWFLSLSKSLRLFVLLLLSTLQKIIPVLITSILNMINAVIILVCIITFLVIFYNRIIILRLIKILALSGINNLVWFLVRAIAGIQFFFFFFFIYCWLFMGIYIIFVHPVKRVSSQISRSSHYDKLIKIFRLLSLGGLPPFLGFLGKLYIIKVSMFTVRNGFLFLLVIRSLIVLFMYMRFSFSILSYPITNTLKGQENRNKLVKMIYRISISIWPLLFI